MHNFEALAGPSTGLIDPRDAVPTDFRNAAPHTGVQHDDSDGVYAYATREPQSTYALKAPMVMVVSTSFMPID